MQLIGCLTLLFILKPINTIHGSIPKKIIQELEPRKVMAINSQINNQSFLYNNRSLKNNPLFLYLYFKYYFSIISIVIKTLYTVAILSGSFNPQENLNSNLKAFKDNQDNQDEKNNGKINNENNNYKSFLELYITIILLTFIHKLIYFLYYQLQIRKNKDNYLYIINRSVYWKNNTIRKEYTKANLWFYKNCDWLTNLLFFAINGIFNFAGFNWWLTLLNFTYYVLDFLLSRLFFFLLDLGVIFFNNNLIDENYIKPDDKTLLIRYYKNFNKEEEEQWIANTSALLDELSVSHIEEEKFDIINNYYDDHLNNNNHQWMMIWLKNKD